MKIRSITYFCHPSRPLDTRVILKAGRLLSKVKRIFEDNDYEVETTRVATVPFPMILEGRLDQTIQLAQDMEAAAREAGIDYASLGPALPEFPASYDIIPEALAATGNIFFSGMMTRGREIFPVAVRACAGIIQRTATILADGFKNLFFCGLANVGPGSPFFPAAYWDQRAPAFAIATEAADLAVEAFTGTAELAEGRRRLTTAIEKHARRICSCARLLSCRFSGIDFSLAPFPEDSKSLGMAFERLGVQAVGLHGSLAAAAILTEAIETAQFPRCGFSGLFLPVFEDSVLARRAAEGILSIKDLLLYSAVCGAGLDTLPLAGETSAEQITALLLDVCALATRLDKPLTARLMPMPGRKVGDPIQFDFAFFSGSRVIALDALPLYNSHLSGNMPFHLSTLHGK